MAEPYNPAQTGQAPVQPPTQQPQQPQETFLQRQHRLYGQQSANSPVSSTGRITAQQQQQQAPQQQGGGIQQGQAPVYTQQPQQYQQVQAQPFRQPSTGQAGPNQVAGPAGGWQTYQSQVRVPQAQQYAPGPQNTYQAAQVQQFQQPQMQQMQADQQRMVQQLMANPYSMSAQGVEALKGQQSEQAMLMNKQQQGQLMSQLASRGIDPGSQGYAQAQQRQLGQDMNQNILAGNRQIDIDKMKQDRIDALGVVGAAGDFQNQALQRAIQGYSTGLQGTEAQRQEAMTQIGSEQDLTKQNWQGQQQGFADAMQQAGLQSQEGQLGFQSQQQAQQADIQRQLANMGLLRQDAGNNTQNRQIDVQNQQFGQSLGFDREKFGYQKEQDAAQMAAAQAAQGAADDRWAEQQAYQYQKDQQDQQDQYLQWLMQGGGGY